MEKRFQFRVYEKIAKKMIDNVTNINPLVLDERFNEYANEYHLMQCTGLSDKNNVLIYEGDIVKDVDDTYAIFYLEDLCQFVARSIKDNLCVDIIDLKDEEIIGNVWENPELLKGEKDEKETRD